MKQQQTALEQNFTRILKQGVILPLKSLGFKKKNTSFYSWVSQEYCHILNIERYRYNTASSIQFRLNIGIFSRTYYNDFYNYKHVDAIPTFPKETVSFLRTTIGELKNQGDYWYDIEENTINITLLINQIQHDLLTYIVPFFDNCHNHQDALQYLIQPSYTFLQESILRERFWLYCVLGKENKARKEFQQQFGHLSSVVSDKMKIIAHKYGLSL